jgi:hypothetical protein
MRRLLSGQNSSGTKAIAVAELFDCNDSGTSICPRVMPNGGNSVAFVLNGNIEDLTSHCGTPSDAIMSGDLYGPSFRHSGSSILRSSWPRGAWRMPVPICAFLCAVLGAASQSVARVMAEVQTRCILATTKVRK